MKNKIKNKKNFDIIIAILREENLGHKDIDHILPFIYFLNKSEKFNFTARTLIFENEINYKRNLDPRVEMFFNFKNMHIEFLYKNNLVSYIKLFSELKTNFLLSKFIKKVMRFLILSN